jgi:hypothetical protein
MQGELGLSGGLGVRVVRRREDSIPRWRRRNRLRMLLSGELFVPLAARLARRLPGLTPAYGELRVSVRRRDGRVDDYGLAGRHLIVTAGKNFLAGCFNNANEPEVLRYHGCGTGTTAPAAGDTALQTESTTALNPDSTRATGSQAVAANVYTTVGTLTFDATAAITEWGLLTQAATGGGTLFDRQTFSAINVVSGDSIQFTYSLTVG